MASRLRTSELTRGDLLKSYRFLCELGEAQGNGERVRVSLDRLSDLIPSDLTTLSLCDLRRGRRRVEMQPEESLTASDRAAFDRHFHEHPLVRFHARHPAGGTRRLSDFLTPTALRKSSLFNEYYRPLGIRCVMAVPVFIDRRAVVSFVVNRAQRDFSERERQLGDLLRGGLAVALRSAATEPDCGSDGWMGSRLTGAAQPAGESLTSREREVLGWVAAGKTNWEIALILSISPRTVQKHMEHVFDKLGVENRTAAVARAGAVSIPDFYASQSRGTRKSV